MVKFLTVTWLAVTLSSLVEAAPADIILEEMWTVWSQKVPSWDLSTMVIARNMALKQKHVDKLMNIHYFVVLATSYKTTSQLLHPIRVSPIASNCAVRFQVSEQVRKRHAKILTVQLRIPQTVWHQNGKNSHLGTTNVCFSQQDGRNSRPLPPQTEESSPIRAKSMTRGVSIYINALFPGSILTSFCCCLRSLFTIHDTRYGSLQKRPTS
jgi:hypothetical protein